MQKEGNKMHISYRKKMWLANKQQKYIRTNQVPQSACGKLAGALKFASGKTASVQSWYYSSYCISLYTLTFWKTHLCE